jgi:hypothetical protein
MSPRECCNCQSIGCRSSKVEEQRFYDTMLRLIVVYLHWFVKCAVHARDGMHHEIPLSDFSCENMCISALEI